MDFELHVVRGRSASQALKLADGVNTVGRLDECQVRIKSSQVSRKHCELFEKQGKLILKDLGSANGTYVNGKRVEGQLTLEHGDELTIGGIKLRVAKAGQPLAPAAPAPAKSPSDTAVVEAVAAASGDDEFEIDFEDDAVAPDDADAFEIEIDDAIAPEPAPPPAPAKAAAPEPAPKAPEKTAPEPSKKADSPPAAPDAADEAIADFLLDIKVDDED